MSSIYNNVLYIYDNVLYISFKKTILKEVEGDILKHTRKPVAVNLDDYIREAIPSTFHLPGVHVQRPWFLENVDRMTRHLARRVNEAGHSGDIVRLVDQLNVQVKGLQAQLFRNLSALLFDSAEAPAFPNKREATMACRWAAKRCIKAVKTQSGGNE